MKRRGFFGLVCGLAVAPLVKRINPAWRQATYPGWTVETPVLDGKVTYAMMQDLYGKMKTYRLPEPYFIQLPGEPNYARRHC